MTQARSKQLDSETQSSSEMSGSDSCVCYYQCKVRQPQACMFRVTYKEKENTHSSLNPAVLARATSLSPPQKTGKWQKSLKDKEYCNCSLPRGSLCCSLSIPSWSPQLCWENAPNKEVQRQAERSSVSLHSEGLQQECWGQLPACLNHSPSHPALPTQQVTSETQSQLPLALLGF